MKKHKKLFVFLAVILAMALAVVIIMVPHMYISQISDSLSISAHTSRQPQMISHRGLSGLAPQNSIPAFELCVEYGYDGCEFDLHTTKDGKWVVIHDDTVDAMTNGEGEVADYTLEEIRKLRLDSGNGIENYENLLIPTLEEVLQILKGEKTVPVIEIKNCDIQYLSSLKALLEEYGLDKTSTIISFNREYLEKYREIDPQSKMMLLTGLMTEDDVNWCVENNVDTISFYYFGFIKGVKGWLAARQAGLKLAAWTIDNTVYKDVMVLLGVETVTTNKLIIKK